MKYWLVKSEGAAYSIDDLKRDKTTPWEGVRNYAARNFMMQMTKGDLVFFYHSNSEPNGIYGIAQVVAPAHPDELQFDSTSDYFEPKATRTKPMWQCADIAFLEKFSAPVTLDAVKADPKLAGMVLRERSRLSVQPVSAAHFAYIREHLV